MTVLKNKTILVISPNNWGTMHISKHHYAIELARLGNSVYFLNPPNQEITFRKNRDHSFRRSSQPLLH
jgi:hypothetical protein